MIFYALPQDIRSPEVKSPHGIRLYTFIQHGLDEITFHLAR
jgi:hypothetical protein